MSTLQSVITWIPVSERLPEDMVAGDRILLVLNERHDDGKFRLTAITLEAQDEQGYCTTKEPTDDHES